MECASTRKDRNSQQVSYTKTTYVSRRKTLSARRDPYGLTGPASCRHLPHVITAYKFSDGCCVYSEGPQCPRGFFPKNDRCISRSSPDCPDGLQFDGERFYWAHSDNR
jgi:hypothetical protein